jgi:hypothetical protein
MKMKTIAKMVGATALVATASVAQAYNLPFPAGAFQLSDNSAEYLIKGEGNTGTTLQVGDVLHGIFVIDDISGTSILGQGSGYDELSGVFETKVLSVSGGPGNYIYTFGPNAGSTFTATYGAGATVAWFTDPTHQYTRETSTGQTAAQLEALVTNGSLLWVSGFADADNFWRARSDTNDTSAPGIPANTAFGQYQWGLDLLTNNSGLIFNQVSCFNATTLTVNLVDQCGNGQILTPAPASGFTTPFPVWDDQNITMFRVPEPASLGLLAIGLLGLGFAGRKAKKSA